MMLKKQDIPKDCPICFAKINWDEYGNFNCIRENKVESNGLRYFRSCGFRGTIPSINKACPNMQYVQFNFHDLESAINFDYEINKIVLYIDGARIKKTLPLNLDFNDYHTWKIDIRNKILAFRNFI